MLLHVHSLCFQFPVRSSIFGQPLGLFVALAFVPWRCVWWFVCVCACVQDAPPMLTMLMQVCLCLCHAAPSQPFSHSFVGDTSCSWLRTTSTCSNSPRACVADQWETSVGSGKSWQAVRCSDMHDSEGIFVEAVVGSARKHPVHGSGLCGHRCPLQSARREVFTSRCGTVLAEQHPRYDLGLRC